MSFLSFNPYFSTVRASSFAVSSHVGLLVSPAIDAVHVEVVPTGTLHSSAVIPSKLALVTRHLKLIKTDRTPVIFNIPFPSGYCEPAVDLNPHNSNYKAI